MLSGLYAKAILSSMHPIETAEHPAIHMIPHRSQHPHKSIVVKMPYSLRDECVDQEPGRVV